jgi:hypothetical protein
MSKKKDKDSWKGRSIERKDFRRTHDAPEAPRHKGKKKKDTKKWCRGKVGVAHTFEWTDRGNYRFTYKVEVCSTCGKHGRYDFNSNLFK